MRVRRLNRLEPMLRQSERSLFHGDTSDNELSRKEGMVTKLTKAGLFSNVRSSSLENEGACRALPPTRGAGGAPISHPASVLGETQHRPGRRLAYPGRVRIRPIGCAIVTALSAEHRTV